MRRKLLLPLLTLVVLLSTALPALAADEAEFTGSFEGLAWAMGAGVVLGIVYFVVLQSGPGHPDEHDEHH